MSPEQIEQLGILSITVRALVDKKGGVEAHKACIMALADAQSGNYDQARIGFLMAEYFARNEM